MKKICSCGIVAFLLLFSLNSIFASEKRFSILGKYRDVTITGIGQRGIQIMHSTGVCWITEKDLSESEKVQLREELDKIKQLQEKYQEREQARIEYQKRQQEQANNIVSVVKEVSSMPFKQAIEFLQKKRVEYANAPNIKLLDQKIDELKDDLQEEVFITNLSDFSGKSYAPKDMERLTKQAKDVQDCYAKALKGDADAQCQMAMYYSQTDGTAITGKPDYPRTLKWLKKAVEQGQALALYNLGCFYMTGEGGVSVDKKHALRCWLAAAEKGVVEAQYNLGWGYQQGDFDNGKAAYSEACRWWRDAAQQGDAKSQYNLGSNYYHGKGVEKNFEEAKQWWHLAAAQNNEDAIAALNECFKERIGRIFSEQQILNRSDLKIFDFETSAKVYVASYIKEKFDNIDHNCLEPQKMYQCERGAVCGELPDINIRVEFRNFPNGTLAIFPQNTADYAVIVELERIQKQLDLYDTKCKALKAKVDYEGSQFNIPAVTQYSDELRDIINKQFFYRCVAIELQYILSMKMLSKIKKCSDNNIDLLSNPLSYGNYVCVVLPDSHEQKGIRYAGFSIDGTLQRIEFDSMIQLDFK